MHKAECRRVPGGQEGGLHEAVEAGVPGGEGAIDRIGGGPVAPFVAPSVPGNPGYPARFGVGLANANALHPPDLLKREARVEPAGKALAVHSRDHFESNSGVADQGRLADECRAAAGSADSRGVEAHALVAGPDHGAVVIGQGLDRRMGDGRARAEHEQSQGRGRHRRRAGLVVECNGFVLLLDADMLQVEEAEAVVKTGELAEIVHGRSFRRRTEAYSLVKDRPIRGST